VRDSARWTAQSLHSLTSTKIDLPRVQNNNPVVGPGNNGLKNFSSPENLLRVKNLPRVSSGRKSNVHVPTKSKDSYTHQDGAQRVDPKLSESFRYFYNLITILANRAPALPGKNLMSLRHPSGHFTLHKVFFP